MSLLNKKINFIMVFLLVFNFNYSAFSAGVPADETDIGAKKSEEEITEDISGKVDKTIKVLSVIKEELKDYQESLDKQDKTKAAGAAEGANWGKAIGDKVGRMIKAWKKARETMTEGETTPAEKKAEEEKEKVWTEDVKNKVDTTISALEAIKEQLDDIEEKK